MTDCAPAARRAEVGERGRERGWKAGPPRASLCCWRGAGIPCYQHFLLRVILFGFRLEQEVLKKRGTASQREEKPGPQGFRRELGRWRSAGSGHGRGLPQNRPRPVGCQGLPRRRQERPKATVQLESETPVLHSSHPLKCPVAALENCCSKVHFQHRNKQCEA